MKPRSPSTSFLFSLFLLIALWRRNITLQPCMQLPQRLLWTVCCGQVPCTAGLLSQQEQSFSIQIGWVNTVPAQSFEGGKVYVKFHNLYLQFFFTTTDSTSSLLTLLYIYESGNAERIHICFLAYTVLLWHCILYCIHFLKPHHRCRVSHSATHLEQLQDDCLHLAGHTSLELN